MRKHWDNCIAHFDEGVTTFVEEYFGRSNRRCLFVAAAGFDPRSRRIGEMLAAVMSARVTGLFIREERGKPNANLVANADANEAKLRALFPGCTVLRIDVFGNDDAPVGGTRIASALSALHVADDITDVVLDLTALSIGIGFPAVRVLLEACERTAARSFHLMITSNPELDDCIVSEPSDRPMPVRGFPGTAGFGGMLEVATVWLPQLTKGLGTTLDGIGRSVGDCYKICPIVPFPARDPRRADALLAEHQSRLVDEWLVDPRDIVYVSERNPLDCYRTLSTLKARYDLAVGGIYEPQIVLSPVGSKVMAAGALMAAIEHDLRVEYLETVRYEFDAAKDPLAIPPEMVVHLLLAGPAYADVEEAIHGSSAVQQEVGVAGDEEPRLVDPETVAVN